MGIRLESSHLGEILVLLPEVFEDQRGFFMEVFRADQFSALGLPHEFVQENHSRSVKGVVRGLHFQWDPPIGKLMRVTTGTAFLVAVDVRKGSPTLGRWFGMNVSADDKRQIWAPAGFARGFCAVSDAVEIQYKCTGIYNSRAEGTIRWNDPAIGIAWPVTDAILSEKDRNAPTFAEWLASSKSEFLAYNEARIVTDRVSRSVQD